jgi:cytochrome oxidase assembly protein ShyY1
MTYTVNTSNSEPSLDMLLSNYTNRLFAISGRFPSPTPGNIVFLGPRVRDGEMGYHVIQPMEREVGGGQVLVERGFVPTSKIVNYKGDPSTWCLMDVSLRFYA